MAICDTTRVASRGAKSQACFFFLKWVAPPHVCLPAYPLARLPACLLGQDKTGRGGVGRDGEQCVRECFGEEKK